MSPLDNLMLAGAQRVLDRRHQRDEEVAQAYCTLMADFARAMNQPHTPLPTPNGYKNELPLVDIINDSFAAKNGTEQLAQMLRIVAAVACGRPAHIEAIQWITRQASLYACFYAEDHAHPFDEIEKDTDA